MRFTTYSKYIPELADALNLQSLLDQLSDFLLQSGFAGGEYFHPYWGEFGGEDDHSLDSLKDARQVEFSLTGKGIDFLGWRTLRHLLSAMGKSSFGSHETPHLATGVEVE